MIDSLNLRCPLNNLSFGNISYNIVREAFNLKIKLNLFPVGNSIDLSAFNKITPDLKSFIEESVYNRNLNVKRNYPFLNIWHINGSEQKISDYNILYTFHESSQPTSQEVNLCNLYDKVFFSSSYSSEIFKSSGLDNCDYSNPGVDEDISTSNKEYFKDKIHFGLMGKLESRKHTKRIIQLWLKKYGNQSKYQLTCLINNPFIKQEDFKQEIASILNGKKYFNINFLEFLPHNSQVNDYLNSLDIDLGGLSGAEGWNLPCFNSCSLGALPIVLNCTAHKDWADDSNSILVEPDGESEIFDGKFFRPDSEFNHGIKFEFSEELFYNSIEKAISRTKVSKNLNGLQLKEKFKYKKTLDKILNNV